MEVNMQKMASLSSQLNPDKKAAKTRQYRAKNTVIVFKDMILEHKDSIALLSPEKQAIFYKMENATIKVSDNESKTIFRLPFDNINNFEDLYVLKNELASLDEKLEKDNIKPNYKSNYTYNRKQFKRIVTDITETKDPILETILSHTIEYHFSRKIKSTTAVNAIISNRKKTLTLKYSAKEIRKNPMLLDFEVNFK